MNTAFVTVSKDELDGAVAHGKELHRLAIEAGRPDRHGLKNSTDEIHVLGAIGEMVVAKFLGVAWEPTQDFNERGKGDVTNDGRYEVRCTRRRNGRLIVRDNDHDDRPYILVTHHDDYTFAIRGWMLGRDAKKFPKIELVPGRAPQHVVLQSELNPAEGIKEF